MWDALDVLPPPVLDRRDLRSAFGAFLTGVCIVTARDARGVAAGLTVNSFSSVSLDPPLVMWSLARSAASLAVFGNAGHFAINVLAQGQEALSNHFAKTGFDKFEAWAGEFADGLHGVPLLRGALATFECRVTQRHEGGDHVVVLGAVERYAHRDGPPLGFLRGRYVTV